MFRVLARTTLMVVAPSAPVAWSPGSPPLTDALRARVLAGAASAAERAIQVLPASGRRVVALPMPAQDVDETVRIRGPCGANSPKPS